MFRRPPNRPDTSALELLGFDGVLRRDELDRLALHTDTVDFPAGAVL
jgi:hypothetical protein